MKAVLKRNFGFSKHKGFPFDFILDKDTIVEAIECHTEKYSFGSCWCVKILYNGVIHWGVCNDNPMNPDSCPIFYLQN